MNIKTFKIGPLRTNCYLVWENSQASIFDVGGNEIEQIIDFLKENNLTLKNIFLTHGHFDHIGGVEKLVENINYDNEQLVVYISELDYEFLTDSYLNQSSDFYESDLKLDVAKLNIKKINDGDIIGNYKVISTPGHTHGGVCYYDEQNGALFSGDTLFAGTHGRTDLATASSLDMRISLEKLLKLPENTAFYPGHGVDGVIGNEKGNYLL